MKITGIIRRVDDLGRILLPKEVRRELNISEGTQMEMFISEQEIVLKKYYPENKLLDMSNGFIEAVEDMSIDLGPETTGYVRQHVREIQKLLKPKD